MSYTVICTDHEVAKQAVVESFREPEARLDQSMGKLSQEIHGALVLEVSQHGVVDHADPHPPGHLYHVVLARNLMPRCSNLPG